MTTKIYDANGNPIPAEFDPETRVWPHGVHVVHSDPGSLSIRYGVKPASDFGLMAAAILKRDRIEKAIEWGYTLKSRETLTLEQRLLFEKFVRAGGCRTLYSCSIAQSYDKIIEELTS